VTIDNLKELRAVIALCRKQGVTAIEIDGIKMSISPATPKTKSIYDDLELPPEANMEIKYTGEQTTKEIAEKIATESLSEEQLLFYSSRHEDPKGTVIESYLR
jgi:hypothetical protein